MNQQSILYRYFPPRYITVLEDADIRFTPPIDFNDPFEFLPRLADDDIEKLRGESAEKIGVVWNKLTTKYGGIFFPGSETAHLKRKISNSELEYLRKQLQQNDSDLIRNLRKKLNKIVGVLSLSANRDNPLIWAYYSEDHKGYILG